MRGLICRGLRLPLFAGVGIALSLSALALAAESAPVLATQTTLSAETHEQDGGTAATVAVAVAGEDGLPATGAISILDHGKPLAGLALNANGQANADLSLAGGDHLLRAVYLGDSAHQASRSLGASVYAATNTNPSYQVSVAPISPATFPMTLTPGTSGTATVSITPTNNASLAAPIYVTLSCSGLPDQASCNFTPGTIEILPASTGALTSTMVIGTQAASTATTAAHVANNPVAWAILFPGALGLAGLAFAGRRRCWMGRFSLLALVGLVSVLGTTGCNPRYNYEHHGPPINPATTAGTYTVTVTAQSNNGITAITQNTQMVLVVQ